MSAESLISLAESKGLLDPKTVAKLRKQVDGSSKPVTAEKIAKALVKAGKLTKFQAASLLEELANQPALQESTSDIGLAEGSSTQLVPIEDEPLEEISDEGLTPIEDDGLEPLDDGLEPLDDGLEPLDDGLEPLDAGPLEELEPLDAAEGLTPLDDGGGLTELDGNAEVIEDGGLDGFDAAGATAGQAINRKKKGLFGGMFSRGGGGSGGKAPKFKKNRWDSPLLLLGGGGLILLILAGVLLGMLLFRGSGDEVFELADQEYQSQSYSQAIYKYEQFIEGYPKHPKVSLGKCRISLAKMRQLVEGGDWERALTTSTEELQVMEPEEAFDEVRPELAGILPEIYNGFVVDAKDAEDTAEKQSLLDQAQLALALIDNPVYLPSSQRKPLQPRIETIAKEVTLIERDINRDNELAGAIAKINEAAKAGQTAEAYAVRKELLSRYPGLNTNPTLQAAVLEITAAEVGKVQAVSNVIESSTADRPAGSS
ncbi:MAG: hypothetical protein AAF497_06335, partial [Planctomycetota bacterium]